MPPRKARVSEKDADQRGNRRNRSGNQRDRSDQLDRSNQRGDQRVQRGDQRDQRGVQRGDQRDRSDQRGVQRDQRDRSDQRDDERVGAVRRFNRFYTRQLGLLDRGLLRSPFSLTEVRVLYELAHGEKTTATELGRTLGLDPGYLSRILAGFQRRGLIQKQVSPSDGRQALLALSRKGRTVYAGLDERANEQIRAMLDALSPADQRRLLDAMRTFEDVLGAREDTGPPYVLRPPRPGDMGWVVHRHGVLYAQEYGWAASFEGLAAGIVSEFVARFDPERERCWIAERHGEPVGSVFLVKRSKTVAQLRLLLVEPSARGLGIGAHLVDECTKLARQAGYKKIMLWTNSVLASARRIYQHAGYTLVHEEPHDQFGHGLIGQTWELAL